MDYTSAFSLGSLIISAVISRLPELKLRFIKIGQQSGVFDPQGGKGLVAFPWGQLSVEEALAFLWL